jgi:hypothetical protein
MMTKSEKYKRLLDLMNIPLVEDAIFMKLIECERMYSNMISNYYTLKNQFHQETIDKLNIFENERPLEKFKSYEFKAEKIQSNDNDDEGQWTVTHLSPVPDGGPEKFFPPEVFRIFEAQTKHASRINSFSRIYSKSLKKHFNLTFAKLSHSNVLGNIRLSGPEEKKEPSKDGFRCIPFYNIRIDEDPELTELVTNLSRFPVVREKMLAYYKLSVRSLVEE